MFSIKIANKLIRINNLFKYSEEYCKDYIIGPDGDSGEPDYVVDIGLEDIGYERTKSEQEDIAEGNAIRTFSDEYLETLSIYRKISEWMPYQDTVLFHGSAIAVDGKGYLFTAKSGTGKSTHTRLWMEYFRDRAIYVNDDKPLIYIGSEVYVHGTPWDGKHRLGNNISVPLAGICILHRDLQNHIEKADRKLAYPMFLQQIYRPRDKGSMAKTMILVDRLISSVPVYNLYCNMGISAAVTAYEGMNHE